MKSRTAPADEAASQLRLGNAAIQDKPASPLAILSHPVPAASVVVLAFAFSGMAFVRFGGTPRVWFLIPLLIAFALIIVLDLRTKIIPDIITLPGTLYSLVVAAFFENPTLEQAIFGGLAGGGVVLIVAVVSRGAVGGGDVKLMAMLGATLGWEAALAALAFSQLAASFAALGLLLAGRAGRRDPLPVGAFISFGGAFILLGAP